MVDEKPEALRTDIKLTAFVQDVTAALLAGKRHNTPGLGTFSTCTRKATADRAACKMAMFRASNELREFSNGGPPPIVRGLHSEVVNGIIEAMQSEVGVEVPQLGRMAAIPVRGKNPKLIFHGAEELNFALSTS